MDHSPAQPLALASGACLWRLPLGVVLAALIRALLLRARPGFGGMVVLFVEQEGAAGGGAKLLVDG